MAENESPNKPIKIRVVDRRPFNAEGERRVVDHADVEPDPAPSGGAAPPPEDHTRSAGPNGAPRQDTSPPPRETQASAQFQHLVLNLARQAAASMGAAKNPFTGQVEIDLDAAQQVIDLLQALRLKTRGNLTAEETEMLEGLLADLQMQFVSVRSKTPKTS